MKTNCFNLLLLLVLPVLSQAQTPKELIAEIKELMKERYVFEDQAEAVNARLDQLLEKDFFAAYQGQEELATALTEQMRKITNDRHLGVLAPRRPDETQPRPFEPFRNMSRYYYPIVNQVQFFEENVGYLDLRFFGGDYYMPFLDEAMHMLEQADALIIDLRRNGGGSVRTVNYMLSYFFEEEKLLNSIYSRYDDNLEEFFVIEVQGKKRSKVPVFLLNSSRTFSGAEGFSYTLQSHGRAKVIGEVSRGGAHPTRSHDLSGGFRVRIPYARSIDPNTDTNWEGIGVQPDYPTEADQALEKAKTLAKEAALAFKDSFFEPLEKALSKIKGQTITDKETRWVKEHLMKMKKAGIVRERDINLIGYNYFNVDQVQAGLAVLKANAAFYPDSPNAHDSLAEVLVADGQKKLALAHYKKAVELAEAQAHWNLDSFKRNLANLEKN